MTLEEKVLQMQSSAPAIPRLNIPAFDWWNEALHGVAQGRATVFPQAIGLAATWDTGLMHTVADTISTEARAKYNAALGGLTSDLRRPAGYISRSYRRIDLLVAEHQYLSRSPLGTRAETYGEDPYLTSRMGVEFVKGCRATILVTSK